MLIVGLGNPGPTYAQTRHNIGFMVVDALVQKHGASKLSSASFEGELYKYQQNLYLKPLTFMNLSGKSVLVVKQFYKIDSVVVIHDDLDLAFGTLRFKFGGSDGGHNGLKSIDSKISKEYIRIRMGIGRPEHKGEVASYVLSDFSAKEQEHLGMWISHVCDALTYLQKHSMEETASKYSIKKFELK